MPGRMSQLKPSPSMAVSQAAMAPAGDTRYPATGGAPRTMSAVLEKFRRENGLEFSADEVVVANGAKQIIFNALMATLEEGDDVILAAPCFACYPDMTLMLGGEPVVEECSRADRLKLTPDALAAAITPQSKRFILNMPGNPSGDLFGVRAGGTWPRFGGSPVASIVSDETCEHILFEGLGFVSFGRACPELRDCTPIVNGGTLKRW